MQHLILPYTITFIIGLGFINSSPGSDDVLYPSREVVRGDTVFFGDGNWHLESRVEIPWDLRKPPISEKKYDYYIEWSEPMRLTHFEGDDWRPKAVVEDSIIHLIWRHRGWGIHDIYYKRSTDWGETWTDTLNFSRSGEFSVGGGCDIEMSGAMGLAFWTKSTGIRDLYHARSEDFGFSWEDMGRYEFYTELPILCKLREDLVILFYADSYNGGYWYDFTADWGYSWIGAEMIPSIGPAGRKPKVVSYLGYIHFGFANRGPTRSTEIFYNHSPDFGQTWSVDNPITEDDYIPSQWPDNAVHRSTVHISWDDMRYGGTEIITIRSTDDGLTWGDEYRLSYSHTARDCHIVAGDAGTFVVWNDARHSDSSNSELYLSASFNDGESWEAEERITFAVGASSEPNIVLDGNSLYLFWIDTRDSLGYYEIYFKKGVINMTGIEEEFSPIPDQIELSQNYPNPFNAQTAIEYALPYDSHVRIVIYNLLGQSIETLVDRDQSAGYHQVLWDATNAPTGVYFYRIEAAEFTATRKMLLAK